MNKEIFEINKRRIEAILFVSNKPVTLSKIVKILSIPPDTVSESIRMLNKDYADISCAFFVEELADGYIFATKPNFDDEIRSFYKIDQKYSLTELNIEVLAIIAYFQPITKIEVEAIRGNIDCTSHIKTLIEKGFIKITGRKKVPGSPFLYGTTRQFLIFFGLKDLSELPNMEQISEEFHLTDKKNETDTLPGF